MRKKIISLFTAMLMALMCVACGAPKTSSETNTTPQEDMTVADRSFNATSEYVKVIGRTYLTEQNVLWLIQSLSAVEFTFTGSKLSFSLQGDSSLLSGSKISKPRYAIYVNGERVVDQQMAKAIETVEVPLSGEGEYTIQFVKLSEAEQSTMAIKSIDATCQGNLHPTAEKELKIEFIGDSITCGYGVDDEDPTHPFSTATEDAMKAYAYKTAVALGADYSLVSYSGHGIISGYTDNGTKIEEQQVPPIYTKVGKSYAKGGGLVLTELDWDFSKFVPDVVVINLGTNDASYTGGKADRKEDYRANYVEFLKLVREKNPNAYIVCTLGIMGKDLCETMHSAVEDYKSASGDEKVTYMDFEEQLMSDGRAADYHPTETTHTKASEKLVNKLKEILGK